MTITLVQQKSGTGTSLSFTTPTTAGNCVIAGFTDVNGATSVTAVKLGGAAGNFAQLVSAEGTPGTESLLAVLWADPNCAGGQTAVAVTAGTTSSPTIWIAEFSGIVSASPLDKDTFTVSTGGSWSSGSTGTTTQANELWLGAVCNLGASTAGPGSPWTNFAVTDGSGDKILYGYDIVSSTGNAVYSGTGGGGTFAGWAAAVAALKGAASASVPGTVQPPATVPVPRRRLRRGQWQQVTGQAFVQVPAPAQQPAPAPRRKLARALIRFVPVTTTNAPPVIPPAGTVQPATAVPAPRRKRLRALTGFTPVTTANATGVPGKVQPEATVPVPRRKRARAVSRGTAVPGIRAAAPRQQCTTPPRRKRARAVVRFTPVPGSIAGRNLIISIASAAGTDDYGNTFPQGIEVGSALIGPQVALLPSVGGGGASELQFPIKAANLSNPPNMAGEGDATQARLIVSGPAISLSGHEDWVQLELFSGSAGSPAQLDFVVVDTGGGVNLMGNVNIGGWTLGATEVASLSIGGQPLLIPQPAPSSVPSAPSTYGPVWGTQVTNAINALIAIAINGGYAA